MTNISVRKLDEETVSALKLRASKHGVSMEEEIRTILKNAVEPKESVGEMMERIFSPGWEFQESFEVPPRAEIAEPLSFDLSE